MLPPVWIWFVVAGISGVGGALLGWTLWSVFDFGVSFMRFGVLLLFLVPMLIIEAFRDIRDAWPQIQKSWRAGWRRGRGLPPEEFDEHGIPYL